MKQRVRKLKLTMRSSCPIYVCINICQIFEFLARNENEFLVTKIAEFEERDLENATEYLKYRLDDKKNHFDVNFYNQEKGSLLIL